MRVTICRAATLCALFVFTAVDTAWAQDAPEREPIGWFAVDLRGAFARLPHAPAIATFLDVANDNVPERGLGLIAGAHLYPLRKGVVAFGVGGEVLLSRGSKTAKPATEGDPDGPTVKSELKAMSPQISLNFGHRQGWSYLTGGMGWSQFRAELKDAAAGGAESARTRTINYGGGARWFVKKHLALNLDLRFYVIAAKEASDAEPAQLRTRLVVMSAGISVK